MLALDNALLFDASGHPIEHHQKTHSRDWNVVRDFCTRAYMPFDAEPLGRHLRPDATMHAARVGRMTVTRFSYGIPIHLCNFDRQAGNILVFTTLRGQLRHGGADPDATVTTRGESFVVDCSRTDHRLEGDADNLQLNLTIPHDVVAETALRWFGAVPDDRLWQAKVRFGGADSAWIALMDYMVRRIGEAPDRVARDRVGAQLEEAICVELLRNWAAGAGYPLAGRSNSAIPRHVKLAEAFMRAEAANAPTVAEVARNAGVSVRALSSAFRRFRDTTPGAFLREQRLQGARRALLDAGPDDTVASIAAAWGYANFGVFARSYAVRFGELPSRTLGRRRG